MSLEKKKIRIFALAVKDETTETEIDNKREKNDNDENLL